MMRTRQEEAVGTGKGGRREEQSGGTCWGHGRGEHVPLSRQCRRGCLCLCPGQAGLPSSQRSSARWSVKRWCACHTPLGCAGSTGPLCQVGTGAGGIWRGWEFQQHCPLSPRCSMPPCCLVRSLCCPMVQQLPTVSCVIEAGRVGAWHGAHATSHGEGSHMPVLYVAVTPAFPP